MKIDTTKIQPYIDDKMISVQRHPALPLSIYNYTQKCQFAQNWDEITKMCRGLILNDEGTVIARPFDKFFNLGEKEALTIPEGEKFTAFDKSDGSLGIMYPTTSSVALATRGSFLSDQSQVGTRLLRAAMEKMSAAIFKPNEITYLFEIIYPENRIVLDYHGESKLIFLGARDIESGKIYTPDFFPEICHYFESADTIIDYKTPRENAEGVVLHFYPSDFMVKVKYEEYVRLHRLVTGVTARRVWECLKSGIGTKEMTDRVPEEFLLWIKQTTKKLQTQFDHIYSTSKADYKKCIDAISVQHRIVPSMSMEKRPEVLAYDITFDYNEYKKLDHLIQRKANDLFQACEFPTVLQSLHRHIQKSQITELVWDMIRPEHEMPFKKEVE